MKMMKTGKVDVVKVMVAALWKGEEIKKSDIHFNGNSTTVEAGSTRVQEVLRDFGFETC